MKKVISISLILCVAVAGVFAATVDSVLDTANSLIKLAGIEVTGWDGLIAVLIVAFVEYVVKFICKKCSMSDNKWSVTVRLAPIVLGFIVYLVIALIQKSAVVTGMIHGLGVGFAASGAYASLVSLVKKFFTSSTSSLNDEAILVLKGSDEKAEDDAKIEEAVAEVTDSSVSEEVKG